MPKQFILPLVNAHAHAAMVAFRGMAEDLPLQVWLEKNIWPVEAKKVKPAFVYAQSKKAILEMQKNGIRIFSDMYFFEEEVARAAEELKMRAVIGECLMDFPSPSAKNFNEALKKTEELLKKYRDSRFVSVAVAPHSINAVSGEGLIKAKKLARKYLAPYHIHVAETKFELDECRKKNGVTPVEYLDKLGVLDRRTVMAHCVWLTDNDVDIIAKRKAKVAHCPLSNLKLGSGIAPVAKLLQRGIVVALGTDGAASSNRLDIWEAGKFAALLQKGITNNPANVSAKEAVHMMTIGGMEALGLESYAGVSLAKWKERFQKEQNFSQLYSLNVNEINFR